MERSYKPALSHEVTIQKMREGKDTHFDPFLVDIFGTVEHDFNHIFMDNIDEKRH
jgi:putative two-component system response regulator